MNLTTQDLAIQEKILLAVHKWCTIEEAREKERNTDWCIVIYDNMDWWDDYWYPASTKTYWKLTGNWNSIHDWEWCVYDFYDAERDEDMEDVAWEYYSSCWHIVGGYFRETSIIWLPPTLSRVLTALGENYIYSYNKKIALVEMYIDSEWEDPIGESEICDRKLLNDDWTDSTLRDQSQETKNKIEEILLSSGISSGEILLWEPDDRGNRTIYNKADVIHSISVLFIIWTI